ncbi:1,5-anhydro-D-fructose reductase [Aethina tumida]|uniref:1,5-anhydro-D-fructose reductase n=1 Tax=Aethina tumida TaxID=116153 RepID=UPI00096B5481|nr:1,5-anhydro-D-fructose reductase [Aethina tumida]
MELLYFAALFVSGFVCKIHATTPPTSVTLNGGIQMPSIGLGTFLSKDDSLEKAVEEALEAGYRHFDTATLYENEHVIGKVLKKWISEGKVKRSDLFIVTKLPINGMRPDLVEVFLNKSLHDLQLDYIDLYLIHSPIGIKYKEGETATLNTNVTVDIDPTTDHIAIWKKMEEQVDKGKARTIGLSNFNISQITRIINNSKIKPSNLQVECNAYFQQDELVDFCKNNNIVVTAYSPIGAPGFKKFADAVGLKVKTVNLLEDPVVEKIAKKHNKSPAQVLLRQHIQRGLVAIPKSTTPKRIRENIDIFDFTLDDEDMAELKKLNKNARRVDFKVFKGIENHPEYPFNDA